MGKKNNLLRRLYSLSLRSIYTWSLITSGIVSIYIISLGAFKICIINSYSANCFNSTDYVIYSFYVFLLLSGAVFSGYMATTISKNVKSGAKSGALSLSISGVVEVLLGYTQYNGAVRQAPLIIQIPLTILIAVIQGGILGAIGGWIRSSLYDKQRQKDSALIEKININNDGFATIGETISIIVIGKEGTKFLGLRLYLDGNLLLEQHVIEKPLNLQTDNLTSGKHLLQVEIAKNNDVAWLNPISKQVYITIFPKKD